MKYLFKKIMLYLILACAAISSLHATIPFTWIKGLYAVTKPEFNYLSPINGLVWYEQGIVENMYRYGDDNDATIKLTKELFYLQRDNISFVPTIRADKPASFFTPAIIGKIMAIITSYRVQPTYDDQELIVALKLLINNEVNSEQKLKDAQAEMLRITNERASHIKACNAIQTKIDNINKQSRKKAGEAHAELLAKNKQAVTEIVKKIKEAKGNASLIESLKTQAQSINAEIQRLEEQAKQAIVFTPEQKAELVVLDVELKKLQQALAGSKDRLDKIKSSMRLLDKLPGAIDQLAMLIAQSMRESAPEAKLYIPYATEQILLALLWAKSNPREDTNQKQDIADFLDALSAYINADNLTLWLQEAPYTQQDYDQFLEEIKYNSKLKGQIKTNFEKFFIDNYYEREVFSILYFSVLKTVPIFSGTMVYYTHTDGKVYYFSDCGETSLRNFFDIILYDQKKEILDINYLIIDLMQEAVSTQEGILLRPSDKLIEFYRKHTTLTDLTSQQLYNEWTQVVENLPGVVYVQPAGSEVPFYEIEAGLSNILKLLNNLLFSNSSAFDALSKKDKLDLICSKLSHDNFDLTWSVKDLNNKDQDTSFVNDEDFLILIFRTFEWKFEKDHFIIFKKGEDVLIYPAKDKINVLVRDSLHDIIEYNMLAGCFDEMTLLAVSHARESIPLLFNFIFLQALKDTEERLRFIEKLIKMSPLYDMNANPVITKLINSLPDDEYYMQLVIYEIIKNKVNMLYPLALEKTKALKNEYSIYLMITDILNSKITGPLLDWATENIKNLDEKKYIADVIIAIVNNKMTGPLLDWAQENVKKIKDKYHIYQTITAILNSKTKGPLLDWAQEKIPTIEDQAIKQELERQLKEIEVESVSTT